MNIIYGIYNHTHMSSSFDLTFISASIPVDDSLPTSLLPKGFKPQGPPGGKPKAVFDTIQQDDISKFLPPGFKPTTTSTTEKSLIDDILASIELEDVSSPIPPSGFKPKKDPKANPRPFKPKSPRTSTQTTLDKPTPKSVSLFTINIVV